MNARVFQVRGQWYWIETFDSTHGKDFPHGPFESAIQAGSAARKAIVAAAETQPIDFSDEPSTPRGVNTENHPWRK